MNFWTFVQESNQNKLFVYDMKILKDTQLDNSVVCKRKQTNQTGTYNYENMMPFIRTT